MPDYRIPVQFYALGDSIPDWAFPETENHDEPSTPTLVEVAKVGENELQSPLTKSEIEAKFYEIISSDVGKQFSQFCVIGHGRIIAIEIPTDSPILPRKIHWLLETLEGLVAAKLDKRQQELN